MKIRWEVGAAPTGPYRSFQRRAWPSAYYEGDKPAAWITCVDDYYPPNAKAGTHNPLNLYVADYSVRSAGGNCPWTRKHVIGTFATLAAAKAAFASLILKHPELMPKAEATQ